MSKQAVFVHGMWSQPWVWDDWIAAFERAGYRCTAVTLPGHAAYDPDFALDGLGLMDYVEAVRASVAELDRPVLVGHSLGGLIAQQVASQLPVSAAVLINSAAPAPIFPLRPSMLPGLARHFSRWGLWRKSFRLSEWEAGYLIFNAVEPQERERLHRKLIAESGRIAYEVGFGGLNLTGSNRVEAEAVRCPLLALSGAQDRIIPKSVSRKLARFYGKKLEYREYPQHAHWMLGEAGFQDRIAEVLQWLELRDRPLSP